MSDNAFPIIFNDGKQVRRAYRNKQFVLDSAATLSAHMSVCTLSGSQQDSLTEGLADCTAKHSQRNTQQTSCINRHSLEEHLLLCRDTTKGL